MHHIVSSVLCLQYPLMLHAWYANLHHVLCYQDCVVFGRVSGDTAARYLFDQALSHVSDPNKRLSVSTSSYMALRTIFQTVGGII